MVIDWMEPADSGGMLESDEQYLHIKVFLAGRPLQQYILEISVDSVLVKTEQLSAQSSSDILENLLQNTTYK